MLTHTLTLHPITVEFTPAIAIGPIEFGLMYELPEIWVDSKPNHDKDAPSTGFRFRNKTLASAVVYKKVNGSVPIYLSKARPLPGDMRI